MNDLPEVGEEALSHIKHEVEREVQLTIMETTDGEVEVRDHVDLDNMVLTVEEEEDYLSTEEEEETYYEYDSELD